MVEESVAEIVERVIGPDMKKIDTFVRTVEKTVSVDVKLEFDHFHCCLPSRNGEILDSINIQLNAKKDSVIVEYNPDNRLASSKQIILPYAEFVEKIKTFF